jgi:hypothetical protein
MREKLFSISAVLAAVGTKVCWGCLAPGVFSIVGLGGTGTAGFAARWLSPFLAVLSVLFLAHSFYLLYVRRRGTRVSAMITWSSAMLVAGFWALRLVQGEG